MSIEIIETHSVLPDIISPGSIVVDCGANVARFSMEMIKRFWLFVLRDRLHQIRSAEFQKRQTCIATILPCVQPIKPFCYQLMRT
jgi:hypothetical protein